MTARKDRRRVGVTGVSGRMGSALVRLIGESEDLVLSAATEREDSTLLDRELGGVRVTESLEAALEAGAVDVVIDFTSADASLGHAALCAAAKIPLVVGSTGFNAESRAKLATFADEIPLLLSPNMSVGVNLVLEVAAHLAKVLGDSYDCEIVELHHRLKKDAPSGTALALAEAVADATRRDRETFRTTRSGQVGARPHREIGLSAVRGGDVVGEHTVYFFGDGERVELTHRATNRDTFASGALRAGRWIIGKAPGLYSMKDVLGFSP